MKTKTDYNSTVNQEIKRQFVQREVFACFSYEMEAILRASADWCEKDNPLPSIHEIENLFDKNEKPQEILEWWIVSNYLYRKLKEKGEPVLEWGNNYYWGRGCSGMAILLDGVISSICSEMEILDGQKYSWAKKG